MLIHPLERGRTHQLAIRDEPGSKRFHLDLTIDGVVKTAVTVSLEHPSWANFDQAIEHLRDEANKIAGFTVQWFDVGEAGDGDVIAVSEEWSR